MTIYERAREFRKELLAGEREAQTRILIAHGQSWDRIETELRQLLEKIREGRKVGKVRRSWIRQHDRLRELREQLAREIGQFEEISERVILNGQREAVRNAIRHSRELAVNGVAEANRVVIASSWESVPVAALEHLVGFLGDGSPLRSVLKQLTPEAQERIEESLITGLARGKNPRVIAREIRDDLDGNKVRAQTIARTEILRSYREASRANYKANDDVVVGVIRIETLDSRTCPLCWALHGEKRTLDEPFATHPNCRGTDIPVLDPELGLSIPQPDIKTGEERFAALSPDEQKEILGPSKFALYQGGQIELKDLVGRRDDPKWGPVIYEKSLSDLPRPTLFQANPGGGFVDPTTLVGSKLNKGIDAEVKQALAAISEVHQIPPIAPVPVHAVQATKFSGEYIPIGAGGPRYKISTLSRDKVGTMVHEFGHHLEFDLINGPGQTSIVGTDPLFSDWRDAVERSSAVQTLALARQALPAIGVPKAELDNLDYLLYPWELWARSYHQFIARRSTDQALKSGMDRLIQLSTSGYYPPSQWDHADFDEIDRAIEEIFRKLKWLK